MPFLQILPNDDEFLFSEVIQNNKDQILMSGQPYLITYQDQMIEFSLN